MIHAWLGNGIYALHGNAVSWTISVEFGFYLLFPLFVTLPTRWLLAATALLSAATIVWAALFVGVKVHTDAMSAPAIMRFHPGSYIIQFAAGMVACRLFLQREWQMPFAKASILEMVATALAVFFFFANLSMFLELERIWPFPRPMLFWPTHLYAIAFLLPLIFMLAVGQGAISRALRNPALVFLGEISFATYMCHLVILMALERSDLAGWQALVIYFGLTYFASTVLYLGIERPAQLLLPQDHRHLDWFKCKSRQHRGVDKSGNGTELIGPVTICQELRENFVHPLLLAFILTTPRARRGQRNGDGWKCSDRSQPGGPEAYLRDACRDGRVFRWGGFCVAGPRQRKNPATPSPSRCFANIAPGRGRGAPADHRNGVRLGRDSAAIAPVRTKPKPASAPPVQPPHDAPCLCSIRYDNRFAAAGRYQAASRASAHPVGPSRFRSSCGNRRRDTIRSMRHVSVAVWPRSAVRWRTCPAKPAAARWLARRDRARQRNRPHRSGRYVPDARLRRANRHPEEIDDVVAHAHALAQWALERRDTS
jgi:hypothetical protein